MKLHKQKDKQQAADTGFALGVVTWSFLLQCKFRAGRQQIASKFRTAV